MALTRFMDDWARRALCALPFLPAAFFALLPKWLLLRDEGFLIAARAAGYVVPDDQWERTFGWLDRIAFFRYDLLLNFLILPLALVLLAGLLRPRWRAPAVGAVSIVVVLFVFADMLSYSNVGRYLTPRMALDALHWATSNPHYVSAYVSLSSMVKLCGIILLIVATTLWVQRRTATAGGRPVRGPLVLAGFALLPAVSACSAAYSAVPTTSFHQPVLEQMVASAAAEMSDATAFDGLSFTELKDLFQRETASHPSPADPRYFGKARDQDILFFLFETGPSRSLDIAGNLDDLPNLRRLRRHALIATAHHSTYPYTSRAVFTILGGAYPIDAQDNYFYSDHPPLLPGWPRALLADGYVTASYAPGHSQFTPDAAMLRSLGIAEEHVADDGPVHPQDPWGQTLGRDQAALKALLQDMDRWLTQDRRYAAIFMPQVGHGPWHDLVGAGDDYPRRGRALMALQDQWLGEIMALLKKHGRLDRTVIVVTADHGVRTRSEDPRFTGGMIDDYSFHVPLLIWSPSAFPHGLRVQSITSHIDLAPTLLDLLGNTGDRSDYQGMALWDPHLPERRTYFFGKGYLGADGVREDGRYFMSNYLFHSAYESRRLSFGNGDLIRAGDPRARALFDELRRMEAIRTSWFRHSMLGRAKSDASEGGTNKSDTR